MLQNNKTKVFSQFGSLLFFILFISITHFYLVWFLSNIIKSNSSLLWIMTFPSAILIAFIFKGWVSRPLHSSMSKTEKISIIVFIFFLILVVLYYLEPIIRYPLFPIGIPNKDLHDGITEYIFQNGFPPIVHDIFQKGSEYIQTGRREFIGYPNLFHSYSAFLMKLGVPLFQSTWLSMLGVVILTSISVYIIVEELFNDLISAAILGGLFGFSTFRLPYIFATSSSMFFSYLLILPIISIYIFLIHHVKSKWSYIIFAIGLSVLAVSYSGIWFIIILFVALYSAFSIYKGNKQVAINSLRLILISLPLLVFSLFNQNSIYWQNTFPQARDFDPYELSQLLQPFDKPFVMIMLVYSAIFILYYALKGNNYYQNKILGYTCLIIYFVCLGLISYDILFHLVTSLHTQAQLVHINPSGFFGGLNHQKVSRLILLQPFFLVFIWPHIVKIPFNKIIIYLFLIFISIQGLIRFDVPLYNTINLQLPSVTSLYNEEDVNKSYTLLSHYRTIEPKLLWTKEIIDAVDFLKIHNKAQVPVIIWDKRGWSKTSLVGWSSIVLHQNVKSVDFFEQVILQSNSFFVIIYPSLEEIDSMKFQKRVFESNDVIIYQI